MVSKKSFYSIIVIITIFLSVFSGILIFSNHSESIIDLKDLEPTLTNPHQQIHHILVFNAENYPSDYSLTVRSIQAVVNSQYPNGTMLFIINNNQDMQILQKIYAKISGLLILQFTHYSNESINIANLINYFSFLIKGYVFFNSTSEIFYPAVINFLANYPNTIAIPFHNHALIPNSISSLRIYNFINKTDESSLSKIADYYQTQIDSFGKNLHGINLWDYQTESTYYFDFVISQKYFSFPTELLNGSFPSIENSIKVLTNSYYNKAVLNEWPDSLARISVPIYKNINDINNLSFYITPFSFAFPLTTTYESIFSNSIENIKLAKQSISEGKIGYSLFLNDQNNTINFLFHDVLGILLIDSSFFNNTTLVLDDSVFILIPEIMYWIFSTHPCIHFIPKIEIGSIIQPIYFPQYFVNQTAFVQTNPIELLRNDWNSSIYRSSLKNHIKGLYVTEETKLTSQFDVTQKLVSYSSSMDVRTSNPDFVSFLQNMIQNNGTKAIIIAISGNDQFLLQGLWTVNQGIQFITSSSNASFVSLDPNTIFNYLP